MSFESIVASVANEYLKTAAVSTPWGTADSAMKYATGIVFYGTSSHGGLYVAKGVAMKMLSKQALKFAAQYYGGAFWFEEDADINVAFLELFDKVEKIQTKHPSLTKEKLERAVKQYNPMYYNLYINGKLSNAVKPLSFSDLKVGDNVIYDNKPYMVTDVAGGKLLVINAIGVDFGMSKNLFDNCTQVIRDGIVIWSKEDDEIGKPSTIKPITTNMEKTEVFDELVFYRDVASVLGKYFRKNQMTTHKAASNKNGVWVVIALENGTSKYRVLSLKNDMTLDTYLLNFEVREIMSLINSVAKEFTSIDNKQTANTFVSELARNILA